MLKMWNVLAASDLHVPRAPQQHLFVHQIHRFYHHRGRRQWARCWSNLRSRLGQAEGQYCHHWPLIMNMANTISRKSMLSSLAPNNENGNCNYGKTFESLGSDVGWLVGWLVESSFNIQVNNISITMRCHFETYQISTLSVINDYVWAVRLQSW